MYSKWKKKTRREIDFTGADDNAQNRPNPNFKHNTKVPSELRSAQQIKVIRKERDKSKVKNMSKDKRSALQKIQRSESWYKSW